MGYAPLDFFTINAGKISDQFTVRQGHMWEDLGIKMMSGFCGMTDEEAEKVTREEFLTYVLRRGFLANGQKKKEYAKWDRSLKEFVPAIARQLGYKGVGDLEHIVNDLRDTLAEYIILDKWVKDKQVLKPDPVFAKYLCETDKLQIEKDTFNNLPLNNFYLDLESCNEDKVYGDILGIFVDIMPLAGENETAVTMYMLRPGNIVVSLYMNFDMGKCPSAIATDIIEDVRKIRTVPAVVDNEKAPADTRINPRLITVLVLQLINYMKVSKPDIGPAPEMKSTYRPKGTVKNKYSEIYKQDVGIRIGATITRKIKAMDEARKRQEKEAAVKGRKPPVPHLRRAHWQRFWTGKGRTVCELKWIEPVFVCGSYSSDSATDVVIHNVNR